MNDYEVIVVVGEPGEHCIGALFRHLFSPALYSDYSTSGRHRRSCREGGDPVRYGLR